MSATACGLLATEVSRTGARVAALPPGSDSEGLGRPGSGASRSWWCCLGAGASPSKSLAGAQQEVGGAVGRCGQLYTLWGRKELGPRPVCLGLLTWLSDLCKLSSAFSKPW